MNCINTKQDEPASIALLRARRKLCSFAKVVLGTQLAVTALLPVLGALGIAVAPEIRIPVAFISFAFAILDAALIDPWQRRQLKLSARLQEDFDCQVLELRWNEFLVGAKMDPEEVYERSRAALKDKAEQALKGWYPAAVTSMPLHCARLVCQRANLMYDNDIRRSYRRSLLVGLCVLTVSLFATATAVGWTVQMLIVSVLVPLLPALTWALREWHRQGNAIELLERLKGQAEKLWNRAVDGAGSDDIEVGSRELQDAIFNHRATSPLVFDFLYFLKRRGLEEKMNHGAEYWLEEYRGRIGST